MHRTRFATSCIVAAVAAVLVAGASTNADAQATATPGVTEKDVTLGFIHSETGVAASAGPNAGKACQARVDAENAKGGVNGRKITLEVVDDKSADNLNAARDLVQNRDVFAVVNNSALAFLAWRFLLEEGVPMVGGGFDGSYYYEQGNENIISAFGDGTPVPGLAFDNATKVMKRLGARKVAAVGYAISESSSENARATETYAADAQGLEGVYLNTAVDFGTTDVTPLVLGIKNAGADAVYMPLVTSTNLAIVQGLRQNNVTTKANILATGYSQELLDSPVAQALTPTDVFQTQFRPVELGGKAVKTFQSNLEKAGLTGVPDFSTYTGYVACDLAILGLANAGESLTRQGFVDAIRETNGGKYDSAGLTCQPMDLSYENFGKIRPQSCLWFVIVEDGKFKPLFGGKPVIGKLVGDPALVRQYQSNAGTGVTTTTVAAAAS